MERSKALLEAIKQYNIQDKLYRESKLKGTAFNNHLLIEWQEAIKSIFKSLNPQVDASGLLYELSVISYGGVIENLSSSDFISNQFELLNIEIPRDIAECIDEVKQRNSFSKKFILNRDYQWNSEKVEEFNQNIKSELAEKAFDQESEYIYLKGRFSKILMKMENLEEEFYNEYQYPINTLFKEGEFTLTNDEFNRFFFYCQLHKRTIKVFYPIIRNIKDYIILKNELNQLKKKMNLPNKKGEELKEQNPFPSVFKNSFAYCLFERLHSNRKKGGNHLADYSYIYRKMHKDEFLIDYQTPEVFRRWLSEEPFCIVIGDKFKTLSRCRTEGKDNEYYTSKELVQMEFNEQKSTPLT